MNQSGRVASIMWMNTAVHRILLGIVCNPAACIDHMIVLYEAAVAATAAAA
jgi:hypothetical protein